MLLRHAIGHAIRMRRRQLGKTLRQIAEESRISLPYLSEVERGRKEPSSEVVAAICRALSLDVDELLIEAARILAGGPGVVPQSARSLATPVPRQDSLHRLSTGPVARQAVQLAA